MATEALTHPNIRNGWFTESMTMWPGQALTLEVEEILHHEKSTFQDVLVFQSKSYGTVLVLDGVVQCTERDEFTYQEMITHLPLNSHPNPKRVLVIGGGDGGVVREVVKHESVEEVVQCEIDEVVITVSKKYLPTLAIGYEHPKVSVHIGDGVKFLANHSEEFDVIITDSSDPVGPAEVLYQASYYELMFKALRPGGIICAQGECQWLHLPLIKNVITFARRIYPTVAYAYSSVPTYPSGQIGFILCSKDPKANLAEPLRSWSEADEERLCRYYNAQMHRAAFMLPQFTKTAVNEALETAQQEGSAGNSTP
ncbi:putrescine aminopropyltransferase [Dimargaris verticillata]|uniref:Putrescine aminopropyltransferase n=1 Tax=Dimargaris verticillata TaxID=2761393 RepID=A0A9W8B3Z1_9FUNG|nr:putrescine aminopropyltransferase [Dimargaris verticillata]